MFEIKSIPAFNDNYIWCIISENNKAYVVDPGTAAPVIQFIKQHKLELSGILITHHHHDHIGGIADLQTFADVPLPVYGPDSKFILQITQTVEHGQHFKLDDIESVIRVIEIPGHTLDHIAYIVDEHLFCGDTLFSAGCGRLFEGTAEQMSHSLALITELSETTKVYPAHEYTLNNLDFARTVEPNNSKLIKYIAACTELRQQNIPTLPSNIKLELQINPFLRTDSEEVIDSLYKQFSLPPQADAVTRFAALRKWKDNF